MRGCACPLAGYFGSFVSGLRRFVDSHPRHSINEVFVRTTRLTLDTKRKSGGVSNMPFTTREAEPVSMASTFWIQEVAEKRYKSGYRLRMQYAQVVMLDFFRPRQDQLPGRAQWPHISITTLDKIEGEGA